MIDVTGGDAPWTGGPLGDRVWCQVCPNPGPMTLDGTNTWILSNPGSAEAVVIDAGPLDEGHLQAVLARVTARGQRVGLALLTHWHDDHTGSAERFAELTGAPVRGAGRGEPFTDGEEVGVDGIGMQALLTPGHTRDSVSFLLPTEGVLFTGDMVLGRGTTVVNHPDGSIEAYLRSTRRMHELASDGSVGTIAPGHGPVVAEAEQWLRYYLDHRQERLQQVGDAVAALRAEGAAPAPRAEGTGEEPDLADLVVQTVYADVPRTVWPAARNSVLAQLDYLGLS